MWTETFKDYFLCRDKTQFLHNLEAWNYGRYLCQHGVGGEELGYDGKHHCN